VDDTDATELGLQQVPQQLQVLTEATYKYILKYMSNNMKLRDYWHAQDGTNKIQTVTIHNNNDFAHYVYLNIVDVVMSRVTMNITSPATSYVPLRNEGLTKLLEHIYSCFNCPSVLMWDVDEAHPESNKVIYKLDNFFIMVHYMMLAACAYLKRPDAINSIEYTNLVFNNYCKRNYYLDQKDLLVAECKQLKLQYTLNEVDIPRPPPPAGAAGAVGAVAVVGGHGGAAATGAATGGAATGGAATGAAATGAATGGTATGAAATGAAATGAVGMTVEGAEKTERAVRFNNGTRPGHSPPPTTSHVTLTGVGPQWHDESIARARFVAVPSGVEGTPTYKRPDRYPASASNTPSRQRNKEQMRAIADAISKLKRDVAAP
jgi:hypothetical protein